MMTNTSSPFEGRAVIKFCKLFKITIFAFQQKIKVYDTDRNVI